MLKCLYCKGKTVVIDSRDHGDYLRRRRSCLVCGKRHTTYEVIESRDPEIVSYRIKYPRDRRSDEVIKKSIEALRKKTMGELLFWIVSRGGMNEI